MVRLHRTIAAVHCAYSNRFWIFCAHDGRKRYQQTQKQHKREDHSITSHRIRSTEDTFCPHDVEVLIQRSNEAGWMFRLFYEDVPDDHCLIDEMKWDLGGVLTFSKSKLIFCFKERFIDLFWSLFALLGNILFSSTYLYPVSRVSWRFRTLFCDVCSNRFGTRTRSPKKCD